MPSFINSNSTCQQVMNAIEWTKHPLGRQEDWPQSLRTTLSIILYSKFPMFLFWGPELYCFYNDAYRPSLGKEGKHPHAIGKKGSEVWPEIWDIISPQIKQVMDGGEATWHEDAIVPIFRNGKIEDVFWTYSYSPVMAEQGSIAGVFITCNETTSKVLAEKHSQELTLELELQANELIEINHTLRNQNSQLKKAETIAQLGSFEWNLDTGKVIWSEQLSYILGFEPGQLESSFEFDINQVLVPEEQQAVADKIQYCKRKKLPYIDEISISRPDGSIRNLEIEAHFEKYIHNTPQLMVGVVLDITNRKSIETEKEKKRIENEALINTTNDLIWSIDTDIKLLSANRSFLQRMEANTGKALQHGDNLLLKKYFPKEVFDPFEHLYKKVLAGASINTELQTEQEWIEINMNPIYNNNAITGAACYVKNITDRKKILEQLQDSENKYRLLFENSPMPKIMYDLETLAILDVNKKAEDKYGFSKDEFFKMTVKEIRPESEIAEFMNIIDIVRRGESISNYGPMIHQKKNGELFTTEINMHRILYNNRPSIIAVINDITDKLVSEKKLKDLNQSLLSSNYELQNFAAVTAHDLQEPLRMVSNFTGQLDKKYGHKLDEKAKEYIHFAVDGAKRMHLLIKDILEYAKVGSGELKKEPVNMDDLLADVLKDLENNIQQTGAVLHIPQMQIVFNGNKSWLYRLFLNLLTNALKFTKPQIKPIVSVSVADNNSFWQFTIQDNGIGIEDDDIPKLFQTYSRLYSRYEYAGTGLGLATCKKIVELHGGDIWVTSKIGKGSIFCFTFAK